MGGNLHKLSAGDGYTYLTKQVAAMDSSERGTATLSDYYSQKGEAPGRWIGAGLSGLGDISVGDIVTEDQMKSLYGLGRHPNADTIEATKIDELVPIYLRRNKARGMATRTAAARAAERAAADALKHSRLGTPFKVFAQASEFRQAVAAAFSDYNVRHGMKWNSPLPSEVRAEIRTGLGREMFGTEFGRAPLDERELSAWIARNSRQRTQACAGYDFTFFLEHKGLSALWALADRTTAATVEQCHLDAAAHAIAFLEREAIFTRTGANGVAQVDVTGVVATLFTHRDSRAGDPYLHSHIAISNKVQTTDGRWLALDGRTIHKFAVWASEVYNTRLETLLRQRLGLRFTDQPHKDPNKRGTRAVVGMSESLCTMWSSRDNTIQVRRAELVREFRAKYGREPSPREAYDLAERASLDTRQVKHEPRSEADQRAAWWREAVAHLGSEQAVLDMLAATLHPAVDNDESPAPAGPDELAAWIAATADAVVTRVSRDRATWQINHIGAEATRAVRAANLAPEIVEDTVAQVTTAALGPERSVALPLPDTFDEPSVLRRRDGTSVYVAAGSQSYTSTPILDAEQRILDAAARHDGRRVGETGVGVALLEYHANHPHAPLHPGQIALVRGFATSGDRLQLALAPAGTGKTTAMAVFTSAWLAEGGTVVGLAPTASAAAVLRESIGVTCDTLDKLIDSVRFAEFAGTVGLDARIPDWVSGIGADTVVVIDEAALASTAQVDEVIGYVLDRGGSVRMVCDDKQLAAISAGGIVRAVADAHGALTLDHVIRFRDEHGNPRHDEAAASLALREGDTAAVGFYLDRGRVHAGDAAVIADDAYLAWADDQAAGLDSVMMAPTHDITRELNQRARADRLHAWGPGGVEVVLRDETSASAGDIIRTTRNDRRLRLTDTDWVRNGARWRVEQVHADGSMSVQSLHSGLSTVLPADYVATEVILGYAATIMTSQGITADTGHTVLTGRESRNDLYMALTRGSRANHLYFPTALTGEEHDIVSDAAMNPTTAADIFARILARDGTPHAATTLQQQLRDPHRRMAPAVDAYVHAVGAAAQSLLPPAELARIDSAADALHDGLTDAPAWATLRGHLAVIALTGADAVTALTDVYQRREIDTAHDVAAVLDWRLDPTGNHTTGPGPLPWLTGIPDALRAHAEFGPYLAARATLVTDLAEKIGAHARTWDAAAAPLWARPLTSSDAALLADLAIWRAATAVEDTERAATGQPRFAIRERRYQKGLDARVAALLGSPHRAVARWRALADRIDPRLIGDPFWPVLAEGLTRAARAGLDPTHLTTTHAATRPLPDEHPAAALWWRLVPHLTSTDTDADPPWWPNLQQLLGRDVASAITDTPPWPALVAAIEHAESSWLACDLLELAVATLHERDDPPQSPLDLIRALTDRIHTLAGLPTDLTPSEPADREPPLEFDQLPPDPANQHHGPPHRTSVADPALLTGENADEDYLAALLCGPEPDLEFEFGQEEARPEFGTPQQVTARSLDDWDPPPPGHRRPSLYPDLPADERVTRLRADLTAARRHARHLWSQYLAGHGTSRAATAPMRRSVRQAADEQSPHRIAAENAHQQWVDAERAATLAEQEHSDSADAAATARACGDDLTATMLELETSLLGMEATTARTHAETARTAAEDARRAWHAHAAASGQPPTTHDSADTAATTADTLDLDTVHVAHAEAEELENQLLRAENATEHDLEPTDPGPALPGGPVATLAPPRRLHDQREHRDQIAQRLANQRLQMLTDLRLAEEIAAVQALIDQTRARPGYTTLSPTAVADQVRASQQRLTDQAAAVGTARHARDRADTLAEQLRTARGELDELTRRRDTHRPCGRARRQLDTDIATAEDLVAALTDEHRQAQDIADQTRSAAVDLDAPPHRWTDIAEHADLDALADELTTAITEDTERTARSTQHEQDTRARLEELGHALSAAVEEQRRREELDDDTRIEEDRIRAEHDPAEGVTPFRAPRSGGRARRSTQRTDSPGPPRRHGPRG